MARTVLAMPPNASPIRSLVVTRNGEVVSLRDTVASVWNGESTPFEFEVDLVKSIPQSPRLAQAREVEASNQSPQPLVSHNPSTTEV